MGDELAQRREWDHDKSLDWHLLDTPAHDGILRWVSDLNHLYRERRALHALDCEPGGFAWTQADESETSLLSFLRLSPGDPPVLVVYNFTPVPRTGVVTGVPLGGAWHELLNSDAGIYGGSGMGNLGVVEAYPSPAHGRPWSLTLTVPPLGCVFLAPG
jgi:1,4-alpha-glucan branching enzyme